MKSADHSVISLSSIFLFFFFVLWFEQVMVRTKYPDNYVPSSADRRILIPDSEDVGVEGRKRKKQGLFIVIFSFFWALFCFHHKCVLVCLRVLTVKGTTSSEERIDF